MDELHRLAGAEQGCAGGEGQAIHLRLFLDEFQRSQRSRGGQGNNLGWLQYLAIIPWRPSARAEPWMDTDSRQTAIQFQLTLTNAAALQSRKLGGTGGPVVTDHQIRQLGMHLQPAQSAPPLRTCLQGAVLTTATTEAGGQTSAP